VPVTLPYVVKAAHRTGRPVAEVVGRLRQVGYTVDVDLTTVPVEVLEPDDLVILSNDLDGAYPWLSPDPARPVSLLHVIRAAHRVGAEASAVAARLAALGFPLADGCALLRTESDDLVLLSRDIDGLSPWLENTEPVSPMHLLRAAERTGRTAATVAQRLTSFGFSVPSVPSDVELTPHDLVIGSRDLNGTPAWLDPTRPVSVVHLLRAAEATAEPVDAVAARLVRLGLRVDVDPHHLLVDALDPDDAVMTSVDLDGMNPWLDPAQPVPAMHVLRAARTTGRDIHDIAARLTVFGYTITNRFGELTTEQLSRDDLVLMSRDLDGADPWWPVEERMFLPHLLHAARRTHRPVTEIAQRLRQLGYAVDADLDGIDPTAITSADLIVASKDLDGTRPWLDPANPISMSHIVAAANKLHRSLGDVSGRLRSMGYPVPDFDVRLPRPRPGGP
jgi:hypothetical protein